MPREAKVRPEDVVAIAQRMRAVRTLTDLSSKAFAEHFGFSGSQWSNIECARGRIGLDAAIVLARELHLTLDWIYLGEEGALPPEVLAKLREAMDNSAEPNRTANITRAAVADVEPSEHGRLA